MTFNKKDPQQDAINFLGDNVIISASAGSGKTFTLIERLKKRIIVDGISIDEVCALTFTEAAASEMKERLLKALNEERAKSDNPRLSQEIALVETAQITTIHAFCLNIIKNYGYVLGIDPSRTENILNEGLIAEYKRIALDSTLQHWFRYKKEKINILLDTFVDNPASLMALETAIFETAYYLSKFTDRDKQIEKILSIYQSSEFNEFPQFIKDSFFDYYHHHLSLVMDTLKAFLDEFHFTLEEESIERVKTLQNALYHLDVMISKCSDQDLSFYEEIIPVLDKITIPRTNGKWAANIDNELFGALSGAIETSIKDLIVDYEPLERIFSLLSDQYPILENLFSISLDFLKAFELEKEKAVGFDFDDFIFYAMKILEFNNGYIANQLKEHYKEIMVDEFQDTNDLQNNVIEAISNGRNVFRVGDLKQSIYGFQGARPSLMKGMMDDKLGEVIHFEYNFRSKETIVDYNNTLFGNLMNSVSPNSFSKKDKASIKERIRNLFNIQLRNPQPIEIKIYQHQDTANKNYDDKHAELIAETIYDLMHSNITIDFLDNKTNEEIHEPLSYKHITVLVRNHAPKKHLKKAFDDANIPHNIVNHKDFFQSDIIKKTIDWLRYSVNPDPYYLVSILNSPYIGYSLDDVSRVRIEANKRGRDFVSTLKVVDPKVHAIIHDTIANWKYMDLVEILIELGNLNNAYKESFSIQGKTNYDFLIEKATTYQSSNNPNIIGFINYVDMLTTKSRFSNEAGDSVGEAMALERNADVVNVVTMHGSKGLQYPVTIVWPAKGVNNRDVSAPVVTDDLFTVSLKDSHGPFKTNRTSILRTLTAHKKRQENIEEYLRLLYVALTRATHKLVIVDLVGENVSLNQEPSKYLLQNFKTTSELIAAGSGKYFSLEKNVLPIDLKSYNQSKVFPKIVEEDTSMNEVPMYSKPLEEKEERTYTSIPFNPDFLDSVTYGSTLHDAIEILPHRTWSDEDLKAYEPHITSVLRTYNTNTFTQELYTFKEIQNEMPILYLQNDNPIQGIIDFYAVNDTEVVLVDFKSDNVEIDTLKERYREQIEAYKKALDIEYQGLKVSAYLYSFKHNQYITM